MELQVIQNKIYEIRGCKVMLDFDLAEMYQVETKILKRAVRRNIERFPQDFMFELTQYEVDCSRCQIGTLNKGRGTNLKYLPFAFTEQGVAMLSGLLNSKTAITVNISIMRAFVTVRQLLLNPPIDRVNVLEHEIEKLKHYIEDVFTDYNDINEDTRIQLELINRTLAELQVKHQEPEKPRKPIGFVLSKSKEYQ